MKSSICTLFEGDYHHGLAALTNSLYLSGFRGSIYAGYRGTLPEWPNLMSIGDLEQLKNVSALKVADGLNLYFIPLTTGHHLTNYKPDFMLELLKGPARDAEAIYYFDPDICVEASWQLFDEWVMHGVALCEDVNSPLSENHPRRLSWRKYFSRYNFELRFKVSEYVNGGFIGVAKKDFQFISQWQKMQIAMADDIGGLQMSALKGVKMPPEKLSDFYLFSKTDQDALNSCVEAYGGITSVMGKEAMAFKPGARMMSHALGQPKPWKSTYFIDTVKGRTYGVAHSDYWRKSNTLIRSHGSIRLHVSRLLLKLSKITARIYGK
ncbi:MAG: hypothetical protein H7252_06845 [Cytophaga sp.]|nr:hypothetical protein [Undibacterium sp.]